MKLSRVSAATLSLQKAVLTALLLVSPWHAFLVTWLKIPFLNIWREVFVGILFLAAGLEYGLRRINRRESLSSREIGKSIDILDAAILAFGIAAFMWLPFQKNAAQWLLGFRFDVLPFLFLLLIRRMRWAVPERLLALFWASAVAVMIFGLMHALFLPQNFLTHFGYAIYQGEFRPEFGLSSCQYLEHTDKICRAVATFGGPTRYGVYLLLVLGMLMGKGKKLLEPKWAAATALALGNIALTFSRSIWIGAALAIISTVILYIFPKAWGKKVFLFGATGIAVLLFLWLIAGSALKTKTEPWTAPPLLKTIFVRESSTGEHARLFQEGVKAARENPLGRGLGTVGPASVRFEKFLTENWYLQIAVEMGVVGLLLFLAVLAVVSEKLLASASSGDGRGLFFGLLGIAVAALFTHAFEETSAMIIFAALAGRVLKRPDSSSDTLRGA